VVGLTRRMVSSGGDPMVFIPLKDAQEAQFLKDNDAIVADRARTAANPALNRPGVPGLLDAVTASQTINRSVNAVLVKVGAATRRNPWRGRSAAGSTCRPTPARRWKRS
jgi:putative ABC transport system permease protein